MATADVVLDDEEAMPLSILAATGVAGVLGSMVLYKFLSSSGPTKVLPLDGFQEFPLIRKEELSHDTRRFTFGLPTPTALLGLPVGQHLSLKYTDPATGKAVQRSYTPVDDATPGEVSLVIKVYKPLPPKFPNGGLMSQHLDSLKLGDTILVNGPKGHLEWYPHGSGHKFGSFHVKPVGKPAEERYCQQIGMMAGGTGITPMLQILQNIFRRAAATNRGPKICVKMIYANVSQDDILVRPELEALRDEFPQQFHLHYTVDKKPTEGEWPYSVGFINPEMVQKHLLFDDKSQPTQFFMCGPPPMIKFACVPALEAAGFTKSDWVVF